ncbi:MAG: hypothetical protein JXR70_06810 [Spirochaetales bacterium]|nr:hypothetical protein [Spirochaetales bacterium]
MGNKEDYEKNLAEIKAIPDKEIITRLAPPVDVFAQESENLYKFCLPFKDNFISIGVDWPFCDKIPERVGALREAESLWMAIWRANQEAADKWEKEHHEAFELRDDLVAAFRYAYQDNHNVMVRLKNILSGSKASVARIQGLNDLSVLGKRYPEELKAIRFDMALLDKAGDYSNKMTDLYSDKEAEKNYSETKKTRNQAYTFLKFPVVKLKKAGQYLFRKDKQNRERFNLTFGVKRRKTDKEPMDDHEDDLDTNE